MTNTGPKNLAASVHDRLIRLSRERGEDSNLVLMRFAIERLLYRLSRSRHSDRFVLKGAMLFSIWSDKPHRSTKDLDLLGYGDSSADLLQKAFVEIISQAVEPDGLEFEASGIRIDQIREEQEYQGQRVRLVAMLGNARIPIQIDIGFGDVITPQAIEIDFPALLNFPAPHLHAYPKETVVAEKLQAMVALGMLNTRMKDFFDLWTLMREYEFQGDTLLKAIISTFERRKTDLPGSVPVALTEEFSNDRSKQTQWNAFIRRASSTVTLPFLQAVVDDLGGFLLPPLNAASQDREFQGSWTYNGKWKLVEGKQLPTQ